MIRQRKLVLLLSAHALLLLGALLLSLWVDLSSRNVRKTRQRMAELHGRMQEIVRQFGTDVDGLPVLVLRDGTIFLPNFESTEDAVKLEEMRRLVRDAWRRPIVLAVDSEEDWGLLSPGPDGLWTVDPPERLAEYQENPELYWIRAPHFSEFVYDEESDDMVRARVLGDDIVMGGSGHFLEKYPHPIPHVSDVKAAFLAMLDDDTSSSIMITPEIMREFRELDQEALRLVRRFIESLSKNVSLGEDSWSHDCERKEGGVCPELYLLDKDMTIDPPIWIAPSPRGWALECSRDELLEMAGVDPAIRKPPIPKPVRIRLANTEFTGKSFMFCIEVSKEKNAVSRKLEALTREVMEALGTLTEGNTFGLVLFEAGDAMKVSHFSHYCAAVNAAQVETAQQFLADTLDGSGMSEARKKSSGGIREAILKSLDIANRCSTTQAVVIVIATGRKLKKGDVVAIEAANYKKIPTHCIQVPSGEGTEAHAKIMKLLTEYKIGRHVLVQPPLDY